MNHELAQLDAHWTIEAVLDARPRAAGVLVRHGMACVGCVMARFETLAEAAREYHLNVSSLLNELCEAEAEP